MAWDTHPYSYKGHLYLLSPETVLAAQVDSSTTYTDTGIYSAITIKNITAGALADVARGMTVIIGSSAGASDLGRAAVLSKNAPLQILVWASPGIADGELTPTANAYITVLDDYRVWFFPPYLDSSGVLHRPFTLGTTYGYDPFEVSAVGPPVPIAGAPQVGTASAGACLLDFDASGSYSVNVGGVIGGPAALLTGVTYSASTTDGANVPANAGDYNNATNWKATATTGWLEVNLGSAKTPVAYLFQCNLIGGELPVNYTIEYYDGATWQVVETVVGNASLEQFYRVFSNTTAAQRWRINVSATQGGNVGITTFILCDASGAGITWDMADGTPASIDDASPEDTSFPPGFRWVSVTVRDQYDIEVVRHIPVLVTGDYNTYGISDDEISYAGATITESTKLSASYDGAKAFDGVRDSSWRSANGSPTGWLQIDLTGSQTIAKYGIQKPGISTFNNYMPHDFTLQYWNAGTSAWVVADTQTNITWTVSSSGDYEVKEYTLATAVTSTKFKLDVTAVNGGTLVVVGSLNLHPQTVIVNTVSPIDDFEVVDQRRAVDGQEITFRIYEDIPLATYPAGTLVLYWEDERHGTTPGSLTGPAGSENIKFWGWIDSEPTIIEATDKDTRQAVELRCVDVAGRLKRLWSPPMTVTRDAAPTSWFQVRSLNMDRWMYYLLMWHSSALSLCDFTWSGTGETWAYPILEANSGSLWDQVQAQALKIDHVLTCDRHGRLWVKPDPLLQATGDRTATVQVALTADDFKDIKYTITTTPRAHWAWLEALAVSTKDYDDVTWTPGIYFTVAPGLAPGQGVEENTVGQRLATGQAYLNTVAGNLYYARMNAPASQHELELAHAGDGGIEPANMTWITLTLTAAEAAQRGLTFTAARFLPTEVRIAHDHTAGTKTVSLGIEREFTGVSGSTYTPA